MADTYAVSQFNRMAVFTNDVQSDEALYDERKTTVTRYLSINRQIAHGTSNLLIDIGGIATGKRLYVETDRTISVALSGTANVWVIDRNVSAVCTFTTLHISNSSGATANVQIRVADA